MALKYLKSIFLEKGPLNLHGTPLYAFINKRNPKLSQSHISIKIEISCFIRVSDYKKVRQICNKYAVNCNNRVEEVLEI